VHHVLVILFPIHIQFEIHKTGAMFADSHLTRKTPPSDADGVYMLAGQNHPSARKLSQIFMKGEDGLDSSRNRTSLLAFFGNVWCHI
jgi:dual oxidase